MGNVVDATEKEFDSSPPEIQPETATQQEDELENIIDLDSAEYKQWLQAKREREGITPTTAKCRNKSGSKCFIRSKTHCYRAKPLTQEPHAAITETGESPEPTQVRLPKNNSHEFHKRNVESEGRIDETRRKYNLKERDYKRRGSVVLILDDKRALKRENEERQRRRQQMRMKYQIPSHRPRQQVTVG